MQYMETGSPRDIMQRVFASHVGEIVCPKLHSDISIQILDELARCGVSVPSCNLSMAVQCFVARAMLHCIQSVSVDRSVGVSIPRPMNPKDFTPAGMEEYLQRMTCASSLGPNNGWLDAFNTAEHQHEFNTLLNYTSTFQG